MRTIYRKKQNLNLKDYVLRSALDGRPGPAAGTLADHAQAFVLADDPLSGADAAPPALTLPTTGSSFFSVSHANSCSSVVPGSLSLRPTMSYSPASCAIRSRLPRLLPAGSTCDQLRAT